MTILIRNTLKKRVPSAQFVRKRLNSFLATLGLRDAEVSILFVGDRAMRQLNKRYRAKDRTTDVLSFSLREGAFAHIQPNFLGDIVVSVPTAERQAKQAGIALHREIERLLVHGLLHLLGYDHEQGDREAERMRRKERRLLETLHP